MQNQGEPIQVAHSPLCVCNAYVCMIDHQFTLPADLTPVPTGVTRSADGCDAAVPPGVTTRNAVTDDAADTTFGVALTEPPATAAAASVPVTLAGVPAPAGRVATPYIQSQ